MDFRQHLPKAMTEPAIIVIIGVALSAIGAIVGGIGAYRASTKQDREKAQFERELRQRSDAQAQAQQRLAEKSEEIAQLNRHIAETQIDLRKRSDAIAELNHSIAEAQQDLRLKSEKIAALNQEIAEAQRDLRGKSEEIAELNKQTTNSITGGDSFCFIRTDELMEPTPNLVVEHSGKYPLYDVYIKLLDEDFADELLKSGKSIGDAVSQSSVHRYMGNITPLQKLFVSKAFRVDSQTHRYSVYFYGRNGVWHQWLRMKRVNGIWRTAIRVTGSNSARIVFEFIDIDFPRNDKGEVEW